MSLISVTNVFAMQGDEQEQADRRERWAWPQPAGEGGLYGPNVLPAGRWLMELH